MNDNLRAKLPSPFRFIRSQLGHHILFEELYLKDDIGKMEGGKKGFCFPLVEKKNLDYFLDMGVPRLGGSSEFSLQFQ